VMWVWSDLQGVVWVVGVFGNACVLSGGVWVWSGIKCNLWHGECNQKCHHVCKVGVVC